MNRNGGLSSSPSPIAMAGGKVARPSRKKECFALLATAVSGIRIVDAIITTVSPCSHFGASESRSLTGGMEDASGAYPNGPWSY